MAHYRIGASFGVFMVSTTVSCFILI